MSRVRRAYRAASTAARSWVVLGFALAACAHGPVRTGVEDHPAVMAVEIAGNEALADDAIAAGLETEGTGVWPWSERRRLDPLAVANDERRIETFYGLHGYYATEVAHEIVPVGRGRVRVVFRVREGEPTRVERLELRGLDALPPEVRAAATARLPIVPGEIVQYGEYEAARALVEYRLRRAGYALAEVEGRIDVYPARRMAFVALTATPGPPHRYGEIRFEGLAAIPEDPLRAIVRRALPRGETTTPEALEDAQSRLFDVGAFRSVRVSLGAPPDGGGEAPVLVRAEERPVHSVVLGGGVGVEQNLQQLRGILEYGNTSFVGGARRLSWRNEVAARFLPSLIERERIGLSAESALELTQPEILDRTDLTTRAAYRRAFREAYEAHVLAARAGLSFRIARATRLAPALNFEQYLDLTVRTPVGTAPLPLLLACPAPCRLAYVSLDAVRDRRENPVSPRRGTLLAANVQYGVPLMEGGFHYLRLEPEARVYLPVAARLTAASRLVLGALLPVGRSEDSPLPQRFYGGGEGGHRGFGPEQLAPLVQDRSGGFIPFGGDGLWLATVELRWRATQQWELVSFADFGDVTVDPLRFDVARAHLALGLGVRYFTLAGPVRLDVAYRVPRRTRFALDTGARVETTTHDYLTLFLSLGEAF